MAPGRRPNRGSMQALPSRPPSQSRGPHARQNHHPPQSGGPRAATSRHPPQSGGPRAATSRHPPQSGGPRAATSRHPPQSGGPHAVQPCGCPLLTLPRSHSHSRPIRILPSMVFERSVNQVTLLGRVGWGPVKKGTIESPMVQFSVATTYPYINQKGEQTQKTDWHRICVFKPALRQLAVTSLKRGQRVHVSGQLMYSIRQQDNVTPISINADQITIFDNDGDYSE